MSQPHSNNFTNNAYAGGYVQQESHLSTARTQPQPVPRNRFSNLPPDVRLPPSFNHTSQEMYGNQPPIPPRSIQPAPSGNYHAAHSNTAPLATAGINQSMSAGDLSRILEDTERENAQLKDAISENNQILSSKLSDLESQGKELLKLKDDNDSLRNQFSASTNQFFEARVAVLGFKCRVMQLTAAQGDPSHKQQTTPTQKLGPHEINAQINTLKHEKTQLLNDNMSLEAVVATERDKLEALEDKKRISDEENQRLQAKVTQLETDARLMEDRLGQAQNHSYQEHSSRSHLSQQLRTTETDNKRIQSQLDAAIQRETSLRGQVDGFKAKEKDLYERIHQLEKTSSNQPPVPKPRTLIQPQQSEVVESLQAQLAALREKIEKERENRLTVERSLARKTSEYQELVLKYNNEKSENTSLKQAHVQRSSDDVDTLATELAQLRASETTAVQSLRHKDSLMQGLLAEKSDLQAKVATLEKQKIDELASVRKEKRDEIATLRSVRDESAGKIASLEERLRLATATPSGSKGSVSSSAMARRLNDALGKVKELQTKLDNQSRDFASDRERWETEKEALHSEVARLSEEDKLGNIEESLSYYEGEVKRLELREATLSQDKMTLQTSLDRVRAEVTLKTDSQHQLSQQLAQLQAELTEKSQTLSQLQDQLSNVNREKEKKSTKLQHLATDFTDLKDREKQWTQERKQLTEENTQLTQTLQQLAETQNRVGVEKQSLEEVIEELQTELVKAEQEQRSYASRLHSAEGQLETLSMSHQQLSAEMDEKCARLKQVETQRNGVQERLKHMDAQLKMYQEDFERERQAREAAVKVRNMVEERIIKKEKEVKELRERLNQQAMTTLSAEDQYDDSTDSNPVGSFRPQSRRLNAPPPDAHSLSPSPSQVRSGEHLMHTQDQPRQLSDPLHQDPAPPIPPRVPTAYPPHSHAGGGQFGVQDQMWTQQIPATNAQYPQTRVRPMTTAQEVATVGGGGLVGGLHHPQGYQQSPPGGHPPQPGSDSGWRPPAEMRRNDLSMAPVNSGGRNNLSQQGPPQHGSPQQGPPQHGLPQQGPPQHGLPQQGPPQHGPIQGGRNNLDMTQPPPPPPGSSQQLQFIQGEWVGPGEVVNQAPPSMACPICGQQNFHTQTDLELHCARCT
ncbi:myosin-11-like isoform X2 [Halichondria panicea]|uniref:myosin-11-like isoform X2 n=1 Tax=Halichondria panicea TaxID=6063 RepID=UPI00312B5DD6